MKCWKCKSKKFHIGEEIKLIGRCYRRKDICLNCKSVRSSIVKKISSLSMTCPCGKGCEVVKSGLFRTKSKPKNRQRYTCKNCSKSFSVRRIRNKNYVGRRYDLQVMKMIERLAKTKKPFSNKYDGKKSPYYSTREIARIVNKRPNQKKIGKSGVHGFLKSMKEKKGLKDGVKDGKTNSNK